MFNNFCIKENLLPRFTNIRLHDQAVQQQQFTTDFRRKLVDEQLRQKKEQLRKLQQELEKIKEEYDKLELNVVLKQRSLEALQSIIDNHGRIAEERIKKKLARLYGGHIALPKPSESYVNLSDVELTTAQKNFLNLGINCPVLQRYDQTKKKAELAILFDDLCELERNGEIRVDPNTRELLQAESVKRRHRAQRGILTPELREAAKQLKENGELVVRRADKSETYVLLNKDTYLQKCKTVLQDRSKFKIISRNPTEALKKRLNTLIYGANAEIGGLHFEVITGDYEPGYFYGNIKTHKQGNPIRPIISQIPTPSYRLAKRLNQLISPYIPMTYAIKSTEEFVDILNANTPRGVMASLDVESLFTNVPVQRTIEIILDYVYGHSTLPPLRVPRNILREMLKACTTEAPFRSPEGKMYLQQDGVAMGSPLGVLFAQAFMANVEEMTLQDTATKPYIYCRYIDDIFVCIRDTAALEDLKTRMQEYSGLRFTVELNERGKLPFLDVNVDATSDVFSLDVYRKPTNNGRCLNGDSECPQRYKISVIRAYVRRAVVTCSSWESLHRELEHVRQMLVNNGYTNRDVDDVIRIMLDRHRGEERQRPKQDKIRVFYRNVYTHAYKKDEKVIRDIILQNCKPVDDNKVIEPVIYYNNRSACSLVMRNNTTGVGNKLARSNVIYEYFCKTGDCATQKVSYIGSTTNTLSRRLTLHLQDGGIKQHSRRTHGREISRGEIVNNTEIISNDSDKRRLRVLEAVFIRDRRPAINTQANMVSTIKLFDGLPLNSRVNNIDNNNGNVNFQMNNNDVPMNGRPSNSDSNNENVDNGSDNNSVNFQGSVDNNNPQITGQELGGTGGLRVVRRSERIRARWDTDRS